jgi:hypothetical protein
MDIEKPFNILMLNLYHFSNLNSTYLQVHDLVHILHLVCLIMHACVGIYYSK